MGREQPYATESYRQEARKMAKRMSRLSTLQTMMAI